MSSECPSNAREVLAELTAMESAVKAASEQVRDGKQVDLGHLGARINMVCDAAVALPGEESRALLPVMEQLIAHLDELTAQLNTTFGHLPKLQSEAAPRAAASAYGRSEKQNG